MPYAREKFTDPASVIAPYVWQINHSDEEDNNRQRNFERSAHTSGVGFVRQQGDDSPLVFRFTGTILHLNQIQQMLLYFETSKSRTIHFRDFEGHVHEVMITVFNYNRHRTVSNPRDPQILLHYYTYTIEMEVINYLGEDFS